MVPVNGFTLKYTTDGSNPSNTNGEVYNGAFTINSNCTVKAVYISSTNKIGLIGSESTDKIDTEDPEAGMTVTGTTGNSVTVQAIGTDTQSGIRNYQYQLSTTSATAGFTTIDTKDNTDTPYIYSGLSNTTYYIRVVVTDNSGRTTNSQVTTATYCQGGTGTRTCPSCGGHGRTTLCEDCRSWPVLVGVVVVTVVTDQMLIQFATGMIPFTAQNAMETLHKLVGAHIVIVHTQTGCGIVHGCSGNYCSTCGNRHTVTNTCTHSVVGAHFDCR